MTHWRILKQKSSLFHKTKFQSSKSVRENACLFTGFLSNIGLNSQLTLKKPRGTITWVWDQMKILPLKFLCLTKLTYRYLIYHEDLEKRGGCGEVAHERATCHNSGLLPVRHPLRPPRFSRSLWYQNLSICNKIIIVSRISNIVSF